jgi:hypothetical protein
MKQIRFLKQRGVSQLFLLVSMLVVAISLPVVTKLVQQNQENRSQAALIEDAGIPSGLIKCKLGTSFFNVNFKFCSSSNGGQIGTCGSDGQWTYSKCANGCTVGKNYCNPVCTANTYKCDGRNLMVCKSDGSGWNLSRECGIDQTCNAATKTCNAKVVACTGWSTGAWGNCVNGTQTRTVTKTPAGCTTGTPVNKPAISQSCTVAPTCSSTNCGSCGTMSLCTGAGCRWAGGACMPAIVCTGWSTGAWGNCVNGTQTRTVTKTPAGCTTGTPANKPATSQSCTTTTRPSCTSQGGTCVTSGATMTGGIDCRISSTQTGKTNMAYACYASGGGVTSSQVCCMPASTKTNGRCVTYSTATSYPRIDNTCVSGKVKWLDSSGQDGTFNWNCEGLNGGTTQSGCSAKSKIDGRCATSLTSAPTSAACVSGTFKDMPDFQGHWIWDCVGVNGGTTAHCNVAIQRCNSKSLVGWDMEVGEKACDADDANDSRYYVCNEKSGSVYGTISTKYCASGSYCVNGKCESSGAGTCGSAKGKTYTSTPTSGLCNYGTASKVTLSGSTYKWTCAGTGTPTACTAFKRSDSGDNPPVDPDSPAQTSLTLSATNVTLYVGERQLITATVSPSGRVTSWVSGKTSVATVSSTGMITAVAPGTATVTATDSNGKKATVTVTVKAKDCASPTGKHNDKLCFVDTKQIKTCVNGTWSNPVACANGCTAGGTVCNGAPTDNEVNFKFTFDGVRPNAECISVLDLVDVEVANVPTNKYQGGLQSGFSLVSGEVDSRSNQVFQVNNLVLNPNTFRGVNKFNYIRVKGPFHLKRRMCQDKQNDRVPEHVACDISLENSDKVYDFKNYTLLAGDVVKDGVINTADRSFVKTRFNPSAEVLCGREGDLNLDGVVNSIDMDLVKYSLSEIDDE